MSGAGTFKFRACTLPKGQRTRPKLARRVPPLRCSEVEPIPPAPERKASRIPSYDEDREVIHEAYLGAFQAAQPESVRIRGMQEFASAILARSRIPSQAYTDPLGHIFQVRCHRRSAVPPQRYLLSPAPLCCPAITKGPPPSVCRSLTPTMTAAWPPRRSALRCAPATSRSLTSRCRCS